MVNVSDWISTNSGKRFHFLTPTTKMIDIDDIAHGLSNICRFGGQCSQFYSVAQHAVLTSYLMDEFQLEGLNHDDTEAYIGDMVRPLKKHINLFSKIENKIYDIIFKKYKLQNNEHVNKKIKEADNLALVIEAYHLIKRKPGLTEKLKIKRNKSKYIHLDCSPETPWCPSIAKQLFLKRFKELTDAQKSNNKK